MPTPAEAGAEMEADPEENPTVSPQELRRQSIERCTVDLEHASRCESEPCDVPTCVRMKRVIHHSKTCQVSRNSDPGQVCPICRQYIALCFLHAKRCTSHPCAVQYCPQIKAKVQHSEIQRRLNQRKILLARI